MIIKFGKIQQQYYKEIFEKAAMHTHADLIKILTPFMAKGKYALDLGCGEGAFSQRLKDQGLKVDSCDIDITQVKAKVDNIIQLDLNKPSLKDNFRQKYDIAVAIEVIEHLEDPWKFIHDMKELITDDGIMLISTPNISSFASRLRFFMRGTFISFEKAYLDIGHITPLNFFQLETIFTSNDLVIIERGHAGTLPLIHWDGISFFMLIRNTVLPFLIPFMKGPKKGRSLVYVLKKKHPEK